MQVTPIHSRLTQGLLVDNSTKKAQNSFYNHARGVPKGLSALHFGHNIQVPRLNQLMNEYRWFINNDKVPAVKSLLKLKTSPEELDTMLRKILSDDGLSFEFIHSIVDQKRSSKYFREEFGNRLPYGSDIFLSFSLNNIYRDSYTKYLDKRIDSATSISELLEIRPDWEEKFLLKKHEELYGNNDFELGVVPEELGKENFLPIVEYLRGFMGGRFKSHKDIPELTLGDATYRFYYFTDGKTEKNVFAIKGNHGESYVIKLALPENKSLDDVYALGTLCKIDTYLTRNYCRNSAPIKYYNHNLNASIYDFIEHQKLDKQPTLEEIEKNTPDFKDLGMRYYDNIGINNFFLMNDAQRKIKGMNDFAYGVDKSEWITVDNDSVSFDSIFHPILAGRHRSLPVHTDFMNLQTYFM